MPKLLSKIRLGAGRVRSGAVSARTQFGTSRIGVAERRLLQSASKKPLGEPGSPNGKETLRTLLRYRLMRQTDVFPAEYSITEEGRSALAKVSELTKLRGVSLVLTPGEHKALKLVAHEDLTPVPQNKTERKVLEQLAKRKLLKYSDATTKSKAGYQVTPLGKNVLAEQR